MFILKWYAAYSKVPCADIHLCWRIFTISKLADILLPKADACPLTLIHKTFLVLCIYLNIEKCWFGFDHWVKEKFNHFILYLYYCIFYSAEQLKSKIWMWWSGSMDGYGFATPRVIMHGLYGFSTVSMQYFLNQKKKCIGW